MWVNVSISPSPRNSTHSGPDCRHCEQSNTGGKDKVPHFAHFEAYTFPLLRPVQNSMSLPIGISKMKVSGLDLSLRTGGLSVMCSTPEHRYITVVTCASNI